MTRHGGWPATGFGQILKKLRAQSGLTQEGLAVRAGCHKRTISQLERGEHEPAWPLVLALAKAFGLTPNDFVADDEPPAKKGKR